MAVTLGEARTGDEKLSSLSSDAQIDLLADFRSELQQLTVAQHELIQELRSDAGIDLDAEELPRLRRENAELRVRVKQLEQTLAAAPPCDATRPDRQSDCEKPLDEKSEVSRAQHVKMEESKEITPRDRSAPEVCDAAVEEMVRELDEQRRQLQEDEANLMQQVRNMEMALARSLQAVGNNRLDVALNKLSATKAG